MRGIDPRTSHMLSERSTTWATAPVWHLSFVNVLLCLIIFSWWECFTTSKLESELFALPQSKFMIKIQILPHGISESVMYLNNQQLRTLAAYTYLLGFRLLWVRGKLPSITTITLLVATIRARSVLRFRPRYLHKYWIVMWWLWWERTFHFSKLHRIETTCRPRGVTVSTQNSESCDPSSNLGGTF